MELRKVTQCTLYLNVIWTKKKKKERERKKERESRGQVAEQSE